MFINNYLAFDIYYINKKDLRDQPFYEETEVTDDGGVVTDMDERGRLVALKKFMTHLKLQSVIESADIPIKIRDLEEKQRILKDRILLIGQNLIETKEKTAEDILGLKKDLEIIKQNMERLTAFLETASSEFPKFARKEDLEILSKQAKMFQPLEFVKKGNE